MNKKILILGIFVLFFSFSITTIAQISIGNGTQTTDKLPIVGSNPSGSYTQQLYYQSEIQEQGDIVSISFQVESSTLSQQDWTIYLGETIKSQFFFAEGWVTLDNLTQVYSGAVEVPSNGGVITVNFDIPFNYQNLDNLVVAIKKTSFGSPETEFYKTTDVVQRSLSEGGNVDPGSPGSADGVLNYYSNITFNFDNDTNCAYPSNLNVSNISNSSVQVEWTENGEATQWQLAYGPVGFNPETDGQIINDNDGLPEIVLTDLDSDTRYEWFVKSVCDGGDSDWANSFFITYVGNDALCDALPLIVDQSCTGDTYSNRGATIEQNEFLSAPCFVTPLSSTPDFHTVWFSFQAPPEQAVNIITDIFPGDIGATEIAVYKEPQDCDNLSTLGNPIACVYQNPPVQQNPLGLVDLQITNLEEGNNYYIQLNGYDGTEGSFCMEVNSVSCLTPSFITVNNVTDETAHISWIENNNATNWEIEYGEEGFSPGNGNLIEDTDGILGETISGLSSNTSYQVYVRSICADGQPTMWSTSQFFSTNGNNPCEKPINLNVEEINSTSVKLNWEDNGGSVNWELEYGELNFILGNGTRIDVNDTPSYILNGLDSNSTYQAYIRAKCNSESSSYWTGPVNFNTSELGGETKVFNDFRFYPNPVKTKLYINASSLISQIILYDLKGRMIQSSTPNKQKTTLLFSHLESGVYFMKVKINKSIKTFKILKQ